MKINSRDVEELLHKKIRKHCQFGICNPAYVPRKKPALYTFPRGVRVRTTTPAEVFPSVKSIIVLIHCSALAFDYSVEDIISSVADTLQKKLKIHTHILNKAGMPSKKNLIGRMDAYQRPTSCGSIGRVIHLKELAYYAGLGQYGKNSLIINKTFGSDIKIQALLTAAELEYDKPILPRAYPGCRTCNICIEACPARIISNYRFSSTKKDVCADRYKDERREKYVLLGKIPKHSVRPRHVLPGAKFICRICQSFCPVNKKHYLKDGLLVVRKEKKGKAVLLYPSMSH